MVHLDGAGWARAILRVSALALTCRHGTSLVSGSFPSYRNRRSIRSSSCLQLQRGGGNGNGRRPAAGVSRVARLRGGDQAETAFFADGCNPAGSGSIGSLNSAVLESESGAVAGEKVEEADGGTKKTRKNNRWLLLGVSEHDR